MALLPKDYPKGELSKDVEYPGMNDARNIKVEDIAKTGIPFNALWTAIQHDTTYEPKVDMCKCSNCEGVFKIEDCPKDFGHHNGWEMPPYEEIECPKCDDGCVDDFFMSEEQDKRWADWYKKQQEKTK